MCRAYEALCRSRARAVVEDAAEEEAAGDAILIRVWRNRGERTG